MVLSRAASNILTHLKHAQEYNATLQANYRKTTNLNQTRNFTTTKSKIIIQKPIVEIGGDERFKTIIDRIKSKLIIPYLNLERDYYDWSLQNRNDTANEVVCEATAALLKHHVGVKCSTFLSTNNDSKDKFDPNGMIHNALSSTKFCETILCKSLDKFVNKWSKPIIICHHKFETHVDAAGSKPGKVFLETEDGSLQKYEIHTFKDKKIAVVALNQYDSIKNYAEACFHIALERQLNLYFSPKSHSENKNDGIFYNIFHDLYIDKYKRLFERKKILYEYKFMEDMRTFVSNSNGGFVWAMENKDVLKPKISDGKGVLAMMVFMLQSHDGKTVLTEPAYDEDVIHNKKYFKGQEISINPISSIFAWTRGLKHRAKLDCNYDLFEFTELLENCVLTTIEDGFLTRDLAVALKGSEIDENDFVSTNEFIDIAASKLEMNITKIFPRDVTQSVKCS